MRSSREGGGAALLLANPRFQGYVEGRDVDLQLTNGGASASLLSLNAFDQDMVLRIALELDLKKVMVGGVDVLTRSDGVPQRGHRLDALTELPSMLEAYQAYGDYDTIAALTSRAWSSTPPPAVGRTVVQGRDRSPRSRPLRWTGGTPSILDLVSDGVGEQITADTSAEKLREYADKHDVALQPHWGASTSRV